jgi:hypothetical protein
MVVLFEAGIVGLCFLTNVCSTLTLYLMGRIKKLQEVGAFSSSFMAICMFDLVIHLFWLAYDVRSNVE